MITGWVLLAVWVMVAWWSAKHAYEIRRAKGYVGWSNSFGAFLVCCLIFGYLSPLVVLIQKAARSRIPTRKFCPYCRFLIPIDATACGHCGRAVAREPLIDVSAHQRRRV